MSDKVSSQNGLSSSETHEQTLDRVRSAGLLTISPELFEKLYLQPKTAVKGDLRSILGNPTPLGLVGFVVGLTPFACNLMGWRGSSAGTATGAANIGDYWFIGGPLLLLAGIFEFILGNTFTYVVFISYGASILPQTLSIDGLIPQMYVMKLMTVAGIFFTLAASFQPFYNAAGAYSESGLNNAEGALTPEFNGSFGFFLIACACLNVFFTICATRINVVFLVIFFGATLGFILAASARWCLAEGDLATAGSLVVGVGASWFVISILGWYLLLVQLLSTMGFQIFLPVGDLTHFWDRKNKTSNSPA